ncbi:phosphotriesterase-related protein [Actinomadura pelletieri DSM 43383]|uniref:Phosphotriesterase-related protein n=1 Tax=Actinomadura pelletieri DSM 43383 TaxID=1120940 RepID=A0A495QY20_9ACTN|nr:phosphotriesterase [Actinomadura pelletieri]RKS78914.1 phosphotriesterase-related protein [Actinomadura pelletieri DSM 43383]
MTSLTGRVVTVAGPIDPPDLGHTVTSVHLVSDMNDAATVIADKAPVTMDRLGALAMGAQNEDDLRLTADDVRTDLADFAAQGGGAVVDVTRVDQGRRPDELARLAETTGITVVMGCGGHSPEQAPENLADEIVREIHEGVNGVPAGVIGEIGALDPDRPADRALATAVADAARRTGAPVLVSRAATPTATHALLDLFAERGADLGRIAVGHCDDLATDVEALAALADRGVFVQFNGLGRLSSVYREIDDQDVAAAVLALAGRGHADRILLSPNVSRKIDLTAFGGGGYGFVAQQFVPYLRFSGADDALPDTLTAANPCRWLTFTEGRG